VIGADNPAKPLDVMVDSVRSGLRAASKLILRKVGGLCDVDERWH
jgi:hypothetical protein